MKFGTATAAMPDAEVDVAQHKSGEPEDAQATGEQQAAVDAIRQSARHQHGQHGADAARADGESAVQRRIAQHRLQKKRQQRRDAVEDKAEERR